MKKTIEERFNEKIAPPDENGCKVWTGKPTPDGYGRINPGNGKSPKLAHVISWELANGPVPEGKQVHHNCPGGANKLCVNASHLIVLTPKEHCNADRSGDRHWSRRLPEKISHSVRPSGRGERNGAYTHPERVLRGEHHGCSKLAEEQVRTIREWNARGWSQTDLAIAAQVSRVSINYIVRGKTWAHVKGDRS